MVIYILNDAENIKKDYKDDIYKLISHSECTSLHFGRDEMLPADKSDQADLFPC